MFTVVAMALVGSSSVYATLHTQDAAVQRRMFDNFKETYDKNYESKEREDQSFGHFVRSLKVIDELNSQREHADDAVFGITHFADFNQTDLIGVPASEYKPFVPADHVNMDQKGRKLPGCSDSYDHNGDKDWSAGSSRLTTSVKNIGNCYYGTWAFAVAEQLESDAMRADADYVLSPQQLLHCVTANNGCSSGASTGGSVSAFQYLQDHGLQGENTYPYLSSNGQTGGPCSTNYNNELVQVAGYFTTLSGSEGCMAKYVQDTGPVSACFTVRGSAWYYYSSGIMSSSQCSGGDQYVVCAQVVGVHLSGYSDYWKVRGSFGSGWGEGGFVRLSFGHDTCHITQEPIFTEVYTQGDF